MGVTIIIFALIKMYYMARKGDIDSKSIASRLPMKTYIGLLQKSSSNKKTISVFVAELIGEFLEKGVLEPKIIEVEKVVVDTSQYDELKKLQYDYDNLTLRERHLQNEAHKSNERIKVLEEELKKFRKI